MKIKNNFLEQKDFDKLQNFIMGANFGWYYNPLIDYEEDVDKFQFTHTFYKDDVPVSSSIQELNPIIKNINSVSLHRVKTNLLTRTPNIVENKFHVDMNFLSEEKLKQWTTSIFYVNTNNGYTKFEDGTKVESVANRMVSFPGNLKHTGTSCTNKKTRVVINFNYIKR